MKQRIASLILGLVLCGAGIMASAQEQTATPQEAAPETPPADTGDESRALVRIQVDADDDGVGAVGRALGTGLAAILEKHVLTRDDLSEEDRAEVREAIAELRGEIQREAREAGREITAEVRGEVQNELRGAGRDIAAAMKEKTRPRVVIDRDDDDDDDDVPWWVGIVAALAVALTLGLPVIIVALILYFAYRRRRLAHDTITRYLASGKDVPPEVMQNLFKDAGTATAPRSNLHKGTINAGLGLGIILCFYAVGIEFFAAIGFIFLFVGLAQLLIWKLEQGKKGEGEQPQE